MITVNRKILQFKSVQHFAGSLTEITLLLKNCNANDILLQISIY